MVLEEKGPSVMHFLFVFYSFFFLLFFKLLIVSNESIWVSVIEPVISLTYQYDYENITKNDEQNCNAIKWNLFA